MTLTACRKTSSTVTGTLTNVVTGKPIQGIEVQVQGLNAGFGDNKKQMKQLGYDITDAAGHFSIDIESKQNKKSLYEVFVSVNENGYMDSTLDKQYHYMEASGYNTRQKFSAVEEPPANVDLTVLPAARLMINVFKQGVQSDNISITVYDDKYTYQRITLYSYNYGYPYFYFFVPANVVLYISKDITMNGVTATTTETLVLEPFVKHHISYSY